MPGSKSPGSKLSSLPKCRLLINQTRIGRGLTIQMGGPSSDAAFESQILAIYFGDILIDGKTSQYILSCQVHTNVL